ncbi:MAG: hypothetical protein ACTSQF_10610 [Candidatus Heimdallarchaeaceae archaeon]
MSRRWSVANASLSLILLFSLVSPVQSVIDEYEHLTLEQGLHHTFILETGTDDRLFVGFEIDSGDAIIFYLLKENDYASYSGGYASNYFYEKSVSETYSEVIDLDVEVLYYLIVFNPLVQNRTFNIHIVAGQYPAISNGLGVFVSTYLPIIIGLLVIYGLIFLILRKRDKKIEQQVILSYAEKKKTEEKTTPVLQSKEKQREIAERIKQQQKEARMALEEEKKIEIEKIEKKISAEHKLIEEGVEAEQAMKIENVQFIRQILPKSLVRRATRAYKNGLIVGFIVAIGLAIGLSFIATESQLEYWITTSLAIIMGVFLAIYRYRKYKKNVWSAVYTQMMDKYK